MVSSIPRNSAIAEAREAGGLKDDVVEDTLRALSSESTRSQTASNSFLRSRACLGASLTSPTYLNIAVKVSLARPASWAVLAASPTILTGSIVAWDVEIKSEKGFEDVLSWFWSTFFVSESKNVSPKVEWRVFLCFPLCST